MILNPYAAAEAFNELVRNPPKKASPKHLEAAVNLLAALNYRLATGGSSDEIASVIRAAVDTSPRVELAQAA